MSYKITEKRKLSDIKSADWLKRLKIMQMRNEGKTYDEIGAFFGVTKSAIWQTMRKIKEMSEEDLETMEKMSRI